MEKYAGGGPETGMIIAQQDFGRESAGQKMGSTGSTEKGNTGGKESAWEERVESCGKVR